MAKDLSILQEAKDRVGRWPQWKKDRLADNQQRIVAEIVNYEPPAYNHKIQAFRKHAQNIQNWTIITMP